MGSKAIKPVDQKETQCQQEKARSGDSDAVECQSLKGGRGNLLSASGQPARRKVQESTESAVKPLLTDIDKKPFEYIENIELE